MPSCAVFYIVIICPTGLQAVMDKMEQMERSMNELRVEHERSMVGLQEEHERSIEQMERSMVERQAEHERAIGEIERSMEEMQIENRRAMNIGPEVDQDVETDDNL